MLLPVRVRARLPPPPPPQFFAARPSLRVCVCLSTTERERDAMASGNQPFPDFTGHWKQVKNENADGYLKELGFPFPIRRLAVPAMGKSTDIVKQAGDLQVVTTINVKGSWTRKFIIDKEIEQANAEGDVCQTTAWWDSDEKEFPGKIMHKSKLIGAKRGVSESWRWYDGGLMVIKSIVHLNKKPGRQAWMLWYFESIEPVRNETFLSARSKLKQITREQKLISEVTEKQTETLKEAMKDLSTIQKAFVVEMLSVSENKDKKKGSKAPSSSAVASRWKRKAKVNAPDTDKAGAKKDEEGDEFFDCDDLTDEQVKILEKQGKDIEEKVAPVSFDDPAAVEEEALAAASVSEAKTFLCFPVSKKSVKRLPTIVQEALK